MIEAYSKPASKIIFVLSFFLDLSRFVRPRNKLRPLPVFNYWNKLWNLYRIIIHWPDGLYLCANVLFLCTHRCQAAPKPYYIMRVCIWPVGFSQLNKSSLTFLRWNKIERLSIECPFWCKLWQKVFNEQLVPFKTNKKISIFVILHVHAYLWNIPRL